MEDFNTWLDNNETELVDEYYNNNAENTPSGSEAYKEINQSEQFLRFTVKKFEKLMRLDNEN